MNVVGIFILNRYTFARATDANLLPYGHVCSSRSSGYEHKHDYHEPEYMHV